MSDSRDTLAEVQAHWDDLAAIDPLWAVLTDPARRGGGWDVDDFLRSGRNEIALVLDRLRRIGHPPDRSGAALDFGCGVGRLTGALAAEFKTAHGVDISARMIGIARDLAPVAQYHHNKTADLRLFGDGTFTFVYSNIVLQHVPTEAARAYIAEFVRVLARGGVCVFQVPDHRRPDSRFVRALRLTDTMRARAALGTRLRQRRIRLPPRPQTSFPTMEMNSLSRADAETILGAVGAHLVDAVWTNSGEPSFNGSLRFLAQPAPHGWASRQYTLLRN